MKFKQQVAIALFKYCLMFLYQRIADYVQTEGSSSLFPWKTFYTKEEEAKDFESESLY